MSTTLDELAIKYNTDKSSLYHNYTAKYELILKNYRDSFSKVLEIGVYGGGSLKMWRDYFPNATIYGLDIIDKTELNEDRIVTIQGDQSNSNTIHTISQIGEFDFIIDDGSHRYDHQIFSFENLFNSVKPGGFYIIEDVCTSYWDDCGYGKVSTAMDYFKNLIDDVNFYGNRIESNTDRGNYDRREDWLDRGNNQKFPIHSIQFMNSTICIQKRF